jgi:hypothetical protein
MAFQAIKGVRIERSFDGPEDGPPNVGDVIHDATPRFRQDTYLWRFGGP